MKGIYKITNPIGRVYIGQSRSLEKRLSSYVGIWGAKKQILLHRSLLKYGPENHCFEVVEYCEDHELNEKEEYYINIFRCCDRKFGLNLRSGGDSSTHSDETKIRMSKAQTGRKVNGCTRLKLMYAGLGRIRPQHEKDKISATMKGVKRTPEQLEKLRIGILNSEKSKAARRIVHDANRKQVVNTETGIIYDSAKDAAASQVRWSPTYIISMLGGSKKNKTSFKYL